MDFASFFCFCCDIIYANDDVDYMNKGVTSCFDSEKAEYTNRVIGFYWLQYNVSGRIDSTTTVSL